MPKGRTQTILALFVIGAGLLVAAILGLFAYMSLTATPLHPDVQKVSAVSRMSPASAWAHAVEKGRQIARANLTDQNLPGLSVAVGVNGEIVWAEAFGWADLSNREPVTPETRFRVGDASRVLTSAAVGLLLDNGKLTLDDEIQKYVREFPKKQWPVTLRQLMAQTAGIRTDAGDEAPLANAVDDDGQVNRRCNRTIDGLQMDDFAQRDLLFEPGTQYRPSTYGFVLLSAAVEEAADERFFTFMQTRIFEPLGMRDTTVDIASELIPNRATFYFPRFSGDTRYGPESVRDGDHSCYAGAGAFLSTPSDLVRFGLAINGGQVGAHGGTLLKPETVQLLQTPQKLPSGAETGYGLGWQVETLTLAGRPARMAGHGSKADFIGGTTYLMTFPEPGLAVAVMTNISFADTKAVALKLAEAFAEQPGGPPRK